MTDKPVSAINGYHAHVYYDADSKEAAVQLRRAIEDSFEVRMGRWHDAPIGPHPCGSYQVAFTPELFGRIVPWLTLNRAGLTIFIHPETGDDIPDHTDFALWLGRQWELKLDALR